MPSIQTARYSLENRGPWTIVSLDEWAGFSLGQTTAASPSFNPSFQDPDRRNTFFSLFPVKSVHEADQVHGSGLTDVPPYSSAQLDCDGLTAARPSVMLTMRTADCYPVYLKGRRNHRFGILHAGWRGLRDQIVREAIDRWFDGPVDLLVGAGIGADRYEVSSDVIEAMADAHDASPRAFSDEGIVRGDCLDLQALIQRQSAMAERPVRSLRVLPLSTGEDQPVPMYSYRDSSTDDRMVSWIFKRRF